MSLEQIVNRPGIARRFFNGIAVGLALMYAVAATPACSTRHDADAGRDNSGGIALSTSSNMSEADASTPASRPAQEEKKCHIAIINMNYDSTKPSNGKAYALIDRFAEIAKGKTVYSGGFASIEGSAAYNLGLSERRSASVGQEILKKGGNDTKVYKAAYGETTAFGEKSLPKNRGVILTTTPIPDINSDKDFAATLRGLDPEFISEIKCADPEEKPEAYAKQDKIEKPKIAKKASKRTAAIDSQDDLDGVRGDAEEGTLIYQRGQQRFRLHDLHPGKKAPEQRVKPRNDEPVFVPAPANAGRDRIEATPLPEPQTTYRQTEKPIPVILARKLANLKNDADRLMTLSKKYSNLIDVIANECSPGAKTGILCSSPEYGRLCSDGNPRTATSADRPSACTQATISARSGLEATALEASNLERHVSGLTHAAAVFGVEDKVKPDLDYATRKIESTKKRTGKLKALPGQFTLQNSDTGYAPAMKYSRKLSDPAYAHEMHGQRTAHPYALPEERAARRETAYCSYNNGTSVREIANSLGVSRSTVYRDIKKYEQMDKRA